MHTWFTTKILVFVKYPHRLKSNKRQGIIINISSESKTKTESTVKEVRINCLCEVVAKLVESLTLIGVCLSLSAKKSNAIQYILSYKYVYSSHIPLRFSLNIYLVKDTKIIWPSNSSCRFKSFSLLSFLKKLIYKNYLKVNSVNNLALVPW